ncbi:MAG: hypothetical protein KDA20_07540 [Phycisphaerales bacterium]|nr:hypothetical protein [Phycisphaerales bacterium]
MSSPLHVSYPIGRAAEKCAATGHVFEPGEAHIACLIESTEQEGLERRDYTLDAWATSRPKDVFAFWRGTIPEPGAPKSTIVGDDELFDLLDSLADADEPKRLAFRYALALLMVRKRLLRQVGLREAKGEDPGALLVRLKGSDPESTPIEILNPPLDAAILADVATQLEAVVRSAS